MAANQDDLLTYERLTPEQRATAWAVVRSIATALWVCLTVMVLVAFYLAAEHPDVAWTAVVPLAGALALVLAMEVKSRDLEKPFDS